MADQKLMIAARNKKGQIGYLSEGLSLPEFVDLFRPKGAVQVLVDYSPVIEELHKLHKAASSEDILKKYNAMFNYWQDAKSYTKESIKILKCEELSKQANLLINEIQIELQKSQWELSQKWNSPLSEQWVWVSSIKRDLDIYIDTLLCFAHSKASLDIDSFKDEMVLSSYGNFIHKLTYSIYERLLRVGRGNDSYLKFIAFEQREKLQDYLNIEGKGETSEQFLLRVLKEQESYGVHDEYYGPCREISFRFGSFSHDYVALVEVFRDLLYRISSVNEFLEKLREGNYEWDGASDSVNELREKIRLLK
ncbi:hypothetical protein [Pseudomonas qingdaonensis]|uniref:hypothetical protein n=1 Tax=Pseudomonas qingdaonensis TaxID=2056231 RepID=UPI00334089FF